MDIGAPHEIRCLCPDAQTVVRMLHAEAAHALGPPLAALSALSQGAQALDAKSQALLLATTKRLQAVLEAHRKAAEQRP